MEVIKFFLPFIILLGISMLITALGYFYNPYHYSHNEPAPWSSGFVTD